MNGVPRLDERFPILLEATALLAEVFFMIRTRSEQNGS